MRRAWVVCVLAACTGSSGSASPDGPDAAVACPTPPCNTAESCTGTAHVCYDYVNPSSCAWQDGCSWLGGPRETRGCMGAQLSCSVVGGFDDASCLAQEGCTLRAAGVASVSMARGPCFGVAVPCEEIFDEAVCGSQDECRWSDGQCARDYDGIPGNPCYDESIYHPYDLEVVCRRRIGCFWHGAENPRVAPDIAATNRPGLSGSCDDRTRTHLCTTIYSLSSADPGTGDCASFTVGHDVCDGQTRVGICVVRVGTVAFLITSYAPITETAAREMCETQPGATFFADRF